MTPSLDQYETRRGECRHLALPDKPLTFCGRPIKSVQGDLNSRPIPSPHQAWLVLTNLCQECRRHATRRHGEDFKALVDYADTATDHEPRIRGTPKLDGGKAEA